MVHGLRTAAMRLIELIDDLLELFEVDPSFNSFHLDGQTIILDDYLQVRPEKTGNPTSNQWRKIENWTILYLARWFLISSESNVRNMLIGMEESRKWGTPVMLGYFPDTFGNMGQTPQLMKQAGISAAAFGRGVKPIGFDNQVLEAENYSSQYSEMWWKGPDQTAIFGLLFANWYSNGNEIPVEKKQLLPFGSKISGCRTICLYEPLIDDEWCWSSTGTKDISKQSISQMNCFQITSLFILILLTIWKQFKRCARRLRLSRRRIDKSRNGWLVYFSQYSICSGLLKQWNTKVQRQLENITEPLATMAYEVSGNYPHDQLDYAWKTLMQIILTTVFAVVQSILSIGKWYLVWKADEVGKYLAQDSLEQLTAAIDTTGFPKTAFHLSL